MNGSRDDRALTCWNSITSSAWSIRMTLPLLLAVAVAIVATVALVAVTNEPKKPAVVRRGAK
jgi:hypothetical protein